MHGLGDKKASGPPLPCGTEGRSAKQGRMWRILKLGNAGWEHMYGRDPGATMPNSERAELALPVYARLNRNGDRCQIEEGESRQLAWIAAEVPLQHVAWNRAFGFRIIDCPFRTGSYQAGRIRCGNEGFTRRWWLARDLLAHRNEQHMTGSPTTWRDFKIRFRKPGRFRRGRLGKNCCGARIVPGGTGRRKVRQMEPGLLAAGGTHQRERNLDLGHPIAKGEEWQAVIRRIAGPQASPSN